MANPNELELTAIVNGEPYTIEVNIHAPLQTIIPKALAAANVTGQGPENWVVNDQDGKPLNLNQKIEDFHFAAKAKVFVTLKAGVGGSNLQCL